MIVYHPKEYHSALMIFPCFVDFLIHQINEDKIEVTNADYPGGGYDPLHLYIRLVNSKEIGAQIYINFNYDTMRGWSQVTPIERFEFILCQSGIMKAQVISQHPDEYDKMLELFKVCLDYIERHDPERHKHILERVDLPSLKREGWKKSKEAIVKELSGNWKIRSATEDFERMRKSALANLISQYERQGYEIIE